jgi:hypothetical protein
MSRRVIDAAAIKHICWVGNNTAMVQGVPRSWFGALWFETRETALRIKTAAGFWSE